MNSDLLDENDDDLDQEEEEQLSDEAIKKAEAELQAQGEGDTSFSEATDKTPAKAQSTTEVSLLFLFKSLYYYLLGRVEQA